MRMSKPNPGTSAPDFRAPVVGGGYAPGSVVSLGELRGKPVILYFYPKDSTPGCTTQACGLRDSWQQLAQKVHLFGISVDSIKRHENFIKKYQLPFPLISDENHQIAEAYGVWVEKNLYGRKYMGVERSTFLIDPHGKISQVWEKVKPAEHAELLLNDL